MTSVLTPADSAAVDKVFTTLTRQAALDELRAHQPAS